MQDEKILEGICCEVENCVHNSGNCCCTDQNITYTNFTSAIRLTMVTSETLY